MSQTGSSFWAFAFQREEGGGDVGKEVFEPTWGHGRIFKSRRKTQLIGLASERDRITGDPPSPAGTHHTGSGRDALPSTAKGGELEVRGDGACAGGEGHFSEAPLRVACKF